MRRLLPIVLTLPLFAQPPRQPLTLAQAEELAVRNHPRLASAELLARAAAAVTAQVESALRPTLTGQITGTAADSGTAIAAGQLPTSALSNHAAAGLTLSQLITDFGRTAVLTQAARLRASAQSSNTVFNRAGVLLQVQQAYYTALGSEAVLQVAQATLESRRVTLRQVQGLAGSQMRSTLDVSFAEVAVSEAELALYQAENTAQASQTLLSAALGEEHQRDYQLEDLPLPPAPAADSETVVRNAIENRPDLTGLRLLGTAAGKAAEAERRLRYPTINLVGVVGAVPFHQSGLLNRYGAVGVNVSLPFLNGGLFKARYEQADLLARAATKDVQDLSLQIAAGARVAWLESNTAFRRLAVTQRLLDQSEQALRFANSRYQLGLAGILEVTQAQLAQTSARIGVAGAKYEYLRRLANLRYAQGATQ